MSKKLMVRGGFVMLLALVAISASFGGSLVNGRDAKVGASSSTPVCCAKLAYCCAAHDACCRSAAASTAAESSRPACCGEFAECCVLGAPCCK